MSQRLELLSETDSVYQKRAGMGIISLLYVHFFSFSSIFVFVSVQNSSYKLLMLYRGNCGKC